MKVYFFALILFFAGIMRAFPAQHEHSESMQMNTSTSLVDEFLMQQGSGTASNPSSSPMHMSMYEKNGWNLMFHNLVYFNYTNQSGPRGRDKFFSTNWFMVMANRPLGSGRLMIRAMLSLEPATVPDRSYPELFQTGETAFGRALVDGQHPHDLFMEIAAQYVHPLNERTLFHFYYAPVGDPAIGPVAYPHRVSAMELPQAPLSHHLQDSTHIVNNVLTAGIQSGPFQLQVSGFHGAEPGENRWDLDFGAIDSWSTRLQYSPDPDWSGQFSIGRLKKPEALEEGDIVRMTASATYNRPLSGGFWATSFIWGRNHKIPEKRNTNSYLVESVYQFQNRNYLTGRFEFVDKDELFVDSEDPYVLANDLENQVFKIKAFTAGYSRNFDLIKGFETGFGGNVTLYAKPSVLDPVYGKHPTGVYFYFRLRPGAHQHGHH